MLIFYKIPMSLLPILAMSSKKHEYPNLEPYKKWEKLLLLLLYNRKLCLMTLT